MFVTIDLGKTTTRVASSKDCKTIFKVEKFPTNPSLAEEKKLIKDAIYKASDGEKVKMLCMGMPGIIDKVNNAFYRVTVYPELNDRPFQAFLQGCAEGIPHIIMENDALLAAFGEAVRGSGKEFDVVAYLTLSTGVGGARIAFKGIDPSYYFSEPGHQIIHTDGKVDPYCGQKGCISAYVSGKAFEDTYKMNPAECTDDSIWTEYSRNLAAGIINVITMWTPEVIIIGGGMARKFDFIYPGLMETLEKQNFIPIPEIRKAALGDDSGLHGGFAYLFKFIE